MTQEARHIKIIVNKFKEKHTFKSIRMNTYNKHAETIECMFVYNESNVFESFIISFNSKTNILFYISIHVYQMYPRLHEREKRYEKE